MSEQKTPSYHVYLPDAMTPVTWFFNAADANNFVIRVHKTDDGLYSLQKLSTDGKSIEDIAFYDDMDKAGDALRIVTEQLSGTHTHKSCSSHGKKGHGCCGHKKYRRVICAFKCIKETLILLAALCILFVFVQLSLRPLLQNMFAEQPDQMAQQQGQPIPQQAPSVSNNPDAVGVPMSADDFLEQKSTNGLPF